MNGALVVVRPCRVGWLMVAAPNRLARCLRNPILAPKLPECAPDPAYARSNKRGVHALRHLAGFARGPGGVEPDHCAQARRRAADRQARALPGLDRRRVGGVGGVWNPALRPLDPAAFDHALLLA